MSSAAPPVPVNQANVPPQAQPAPNPDADAPVWNPIRKVGLYLLMFYLFVSISRVLDVSGPRLRLPLVLYTGMGIAGVLSGGLFRLFRSPVAILMMALVLWEAITVPFSSWPGGSLLMLWEAIRAVGLGAVIVGLCLKSDDPSRVMRTIAYSVLAGAIAGMFFGTFQLGRLVVERGSFHDPNYYAVTMLMGLPMWLMIIALAPNIFVRVGALAATIPVVWTFLQAGSRGGMLGLLTVMLLLFFQVKGVYKLLVIVGVGVAVFIGTLALPDYLKTRFVTVFSSSPDASEELLAADVGSSEARLTVFWRSVVLTLKHPVFGVGLDQFAQSSWQYGKTVGGYATNSVSHNTYTQISSETGIPGLLIFLGLIVQSFRALNRVIRSARAGTQRPPPIVVSAAIYLRLSYIGLCVSATFLSLGYSPLFFIMAALTASIDQIAQGYTRHWPALQPAPAPHGAGKIGAWS